jgi:hypothetical protein
MTVFRGVIVVLAGLTAACGSSDAPAPAPVTATAGTEAPAVSLAAEADPAAAPATAPATREDVVQALRCHSALSNAMAAGVVVGDGRPAPTIGQATRWITEADRRAKAAGVDDATFATLMSDTRVPMTTPEQRAENAPVVKECLETLPGN